MSLDAIVALVLPVSIWLAASFPKHKQNTTAAGLLFLLVNGAVTAPYVQGMKHRAESATTPLHRDIL